MPLFSTILLNKTSRTQSLLDLARISSLHLFPMVLLVANLIFKIQLINLKKFSGQRFFVLDPIISFPEKPQPSDEKSLF